MRYGWTGVRYASPKQWLCWVITVLSVVISAPRAFDTPGNYVDLSKPTVTVQTWIILRKGEWTYFFSDWKNSRQTINPTFTVWLLSQWWKSILFVLALLVNLKLTITALKTILVCHLQVCYTDVIVWFKQNIYSGIRVLTNLPKCQELWIVN